MLTSIEENNVKNVYEKIAVHFDNTRVYTWKWIDEFINSFPKNSTICDVGCGNGRNMMFPEYNFIGVDNCRAFLDICISKNLQVVEANMTKLPFKNNKFNGIICIAAFHHIYSNISKIECLLEMKRIIKSGGRILLSVWAKQQPEKTRRVFNSYGHNFVEWNKYGEVYHRYYYIFKESELKKLFAEVGLVIVNSKYDCGNEIYILTKL